MKSPVKYFGGKSFMTDIILNNFPKEYKIYVEGFGGGGSILFAKEPTSLEIYNDLGKNVYSLFKVISDKEKFNRLKERLDLVFYSADLRAEYKAFLKDPSISLEDRAFYFFYVNRSSFNGVGGLSRTMLVRRNTSKSVSDFLSAIDRLPEVHARLSHIIVENTNALNLLDKYNQDNVFFYLDPPYVKSTRKSGQNYEVEMEDSEHLELIKKVIASNAKILISGYNCEIYDELNCNKNWTRVDFQSPNSGSEAVESLWRNY
jgi:DNA adenine methylase